MPTAAPTRTDTKRTSQPRLATAAPRSARGPAADPFGEHVARADVFARKVVRAGIEVTDDMHSREALWQAVLELAPHMNPDYLKFDDSDDGGELAEARIFAAFLIGLGVGRRLTSGTL